MAVKIEKKIVGYKVHKPSDVAPASEPVQEQPQPVEMNEKIERPDFLLGTTYKIKPPVSEHAFYITINDILLNEGTDHETRRPYEIFINSKSMEHFQWVIALTRVISAVFRKGGDITFLLEELLSVHDPSGGYYKKGGVFVPSLVAEIGAVIEKHMKALGIIESEELSDAHKRMIAEKRAEYEARQKNEANADGSAFPANATMCKKCSQKSVILMDGCQTCLNCGDSKCG
ncbi:NrdJb [Hahella sp. KA22]|uniref:TSCPD domain-containing protein n=1 Tax=Hahella sp. KA22 TaxID=1628392 RepID=UPI000FDDD729|nr:NrdJb [Hahella sp. KA22]AZZ91218.1 NrdJb [Hahella sp. KA22]QAY54586.1 NrdJb [Hahella sp. KA22]